MPKFDVTAPDGQKYEVNAPTGASEQDAIAYVQKEFYGAKPVNMPQVGLGSKLQQAIDYLPRMTGLTARAGVQGVGDTLDFLASPFRSLMNAGGMNIQGRTGEALANLLNLPKPETMAEKVGVKGAELISGTMVPMRAAQQAQKFAASPVVRSVLEPISANPAYQGLAAAGAGTAGEYVKETGGGPGAQTLAALTGGVVVPASVGLAQSAVGSASRMVRNLSQPQAVQAQIDVTINNALKDSGYRLSDLPAAVQNKLRDDVASIVKAGGNLNADSLRRLADYRMVGAIPLKGNLTLNPADVSRQQNLGKLGINSQDETLQRIGMNANTNNTRLIEGLNNLGANTVDDAVSAGQKVVGAVAAKNSTAKKVIDTLYSNARDSAGRSVPLDGAAFVNQADDLLKKNLLQGRIPEDVRGHLNAIAQGNVPFDVDYAEQLKTLMGDIARANKGTPEAKAMGLIRSALDNTPAASGLGDDAIAAFNRARRVNSAWMKVVDSTPALQAIRDGIEPDKFVQQFVIGSGQKSNVMDVARLKSLVSKNHEAQQAIRGQIAAHLKAKALNNASDEVGKFSQSTYNNALKAIGDRKLGMFFSADEVAQMKAIGRVASYEQAQPVGSAVNNSNTAGAAISTLLDSLGNSQLLRKIPLGAEILGNPAKSISANLQAGQIINPETALLQPVRKSMMFPPAALISAGGLLSSP